MHGDIAPGAPAHHKLAVSSSVLKTPARGTGVRVSALHTLATSTPRRARGFSAREGDAKEPLL